MGSNPKYIKSPGDYNSYSVYTWDEFWKKNRKNYNIGTVDAVNLMRRFAQRVHEIILTNPDGFRFNFGTLMIAGARGDYKDITRSNREKRIDYRNLKTDKVVYTVRYIYGRGRGRVYTGILWRFRTTVPLRQKIKQMIDEGNFKHWYVFENYGDVPAHEIPVEFIKYDKTRNSSKTT